MKPVLPVSRDGRTQLAEQHTAANVVIFQMRLWQIADGISKFRESGAHVLARHTYIQLEC